MQHTSDAVTVLDADLVITYASPSCLDVMLVAPETLTGSRFVDHVEASDLELVESAIAEARTTRGPTTIRYGVQRSDGSARIFESRIEDLLDDPVIGGITINTRDVTEVESEAHARDRSEAAFRTVVRSAPAAIYAVDVDGKIQLWNPACEAMFGWSADEVIGESPPFLTDPQRVEASQRATRLLAGEEINAEETFRRRDGGELTVGLSVAPIVAGDGSISSVITVALDLTDRVNATAQLEHRAEVDRTIAACSRAMVDATPETFEDCLRKTLHTLVDQFQASAAALYLRDTESAVAQWPAEADLAGCLVFDGRPAGPFTIPNESGETIAAGWVMTADSGQLGIVALKWDHPTTTDVADLESLDVIGAAMIAARDRVAAETAVRESDLRFRALAEHSTDLVMVVGADLQPKYVSPAASRFLGITDHDRFDPASSVLHPDDSDTVHAQMAEILAELVGTQSAPIVARFLRSDGEYRWIEMTVTNLLEEPLVAGLVLNGRDVTERRDVDDQLRESESKFRGLVQNLAEGVTVLAADGSVKYSSPSASRMMGFEVGHGMGKIGLDFVVEEDRDRAAEIVGAGLHRAGDPGSDRRCGCTRRTARSAWSRPSATTGSTIPRSRASSSPPATSPSASRRRGRPAERRPPERAGGEPLGRRSRSSSAEGEIVYTSPAAESRCSGSSRVTRANRPAARVHPDERDAVDRARRTDRRREHRAGAVPARGRDGSGARGGDRARHDRRPRCRWHRGHHSRRDGSDPCRAARRRPGPRAHARSPEVRRCRSTLGALCEVLERHVGDVLCGFLLVDQYRQILRLSAGPRVPNGLGRRVSRRSDRAVPRTCSARLRPGGQPRWCSTSRTTRAPKASATSRSVWHLGRLDDADLRLAVAAACSGPSSTFLEHAREPTAAEREVVQMFAQTAAIAIERQTTEDLLAHRANHDSAHRSAEPRPVRRVPRPWRWPGPSATAARSRCCSSTSTASSTSTTASATTPATRCSARLARRSPRSDAPERRGRSLRRRRVHRAVRRSRLGSRSRSTVADIARRLLEVDRAAVAPRRRGPTAVGEPRHRDGVAGVHPRGSAPRRRRRDVRGEAARQGAVRGLRRRHAIVGARARLDLEARLERAIEREEFRLVLQPIDRPAHRPVRRRRGAAAVAGPGVRVS